MRITLNYELASKPDKTGLYSIMLRLHAKGHKPARLLSGVEIATPDRYWNKAKTWERWIKTSHPYQSTLNKKLKEFYMATETQITIWQKTEASLTPARLKARFEQAETGDQFSLLATTAIDGLTDLSVDTRGNKHVAVASLVSVFGSALTLEQIDATLVQRYQNALIKNGLSGMTINEYLARLHTVYVEVLVCRGTPRRRAKLQSPFLDVEPLKAKPKKKDTLTLSDSLPLTSIKARRRTYTITQQTAWHVWHLCYQLAGMRISDALLLRYNNFAIDETGQLRCTYQMKKNGKVISMPIGHAADTIRFFTQPGYQPDDYLLPFLKNSASYAQLHTRDQIRAAPVAVQKQLAEDIAHFRFEINRALKRLTDDADIKLNLTTHTARHTLAINAQAQVNAGKLAKGAIQNGLAHENASTTRIYTGTEIIRADEVIESVFGKAPDTQSE